MLGRLPRVAVFALLCTALVVGSWLLLPSPSDHSTGTAARIPGQAAGDGSDMTPTEARTGRVSRNSRVKPAPSKSTKPKSSDKPLTGDALLEQKVIELTNAERDKAGCGSVHLDTRLRTASRNHSVDMAQHENMSHDGSDGSTPWDRAEAAGYDAAMSENIAMGYGTPDAVMAAWMNSDGHRQNILNCDAKAVGVGLARTSDGTAYWTQMFGRV